jgi:type I restriction enzyme S subunit
MNMVEWKELGDVCKIVRGKRVTKGELIENGRYPVISGGVTPMGYIDSYNREPNTITVSQYGTAGYVDFQHSRFWANDICYCIYPESNLDNKYLWYVLKNKQDLLYAIRNTDAIPYSLPPDTLNSVSIPIPTISEQQRIVDILDTFTSSIDNLKQQIVQRRKQYEFYRDQSLTFDKREIKEELSFGNDFMLKARIGWQGLTKKEYREKGDFKLITGTDFTPNNRIDFDNCVYVDKERYDQDPYIQIHEDDVLITKDGTLGKIAYIDRLEMPATLNGGVFVVRDNQKRVMPKFLMYYLTSSHFVLWMKQNHTQGSIQHLTQALLSKFTIPVVSNERQKEIVYRLDAFTDSINNLEAQLAQREKQYEYYRNKLLTFE